MPSPKPKPAALKLVEGRGHGRDSGGRLVKEPPAFNRLPPEAPDWLPLEARAEWERVVPELARLNLTKPVDRAALSAYCLTWARLMQAQRDLDASGLMLVDDKGNLRRNPALVTAEAASKEMRAWCGEFGFTPSSEARLGAGEADDGGRDNPFADGAAASQ